MRPDSVGLGGFDSHTLPPRRVATAALIATIWFGATLVGTTPLRAQELDGQRAGVSRPDSLTVSDAVVDDTLAVAPITPRRAFLYSLVLPGAGQAKLDRAYAGGLFVLVEIAALTLVHRSKEDLRIARAFRADSMPRTYQTDPVTGVVALDTLGAPIVTSWETSRYSAAWVRTRRLHLEDWTALLIFNHLFAGADAFVAAQLWDLPVKVNLERTPVGTALTASIPLGRRRE